MNEPVSQRTTLRRYAHRAVEAALEDPALRGDVDMPDYVVNYQRLSRRRTTTGRN